MGTETLGHQVVDLFGKAEELGDRGFTGGVELSLSSVCTTMLEWVLPTAVGAVAILLVERFRPRVRVESVDRIGWREALVAAAAESGVEPWVLAALARQESVFTAGARSPRGALGVLQLLPSTARGHARALGLGERPELRDPELNLRLGARELARLRSRFGELEPALAAYNAGETRVRGWLRRQPDHRRFTEAIPIPETYTYVRRVVYLAECYRALYTDDWGRLP